MSRRVESEHAGTRRAVHMAELKSVDLLATGDALEFTYKGVTYCGRVTRDGYIETARHERHALADRADDEHSYYRVPTNFANDCVAASSAERSLANPNGYAHVRHVRSGKALNDLRDEYLERFPHVSVQYADDIVEARQRSGKRRRSKSSPHHVAPPSEPAALGRETAKILGDGAITIATLRAEDGSRKYKELAELLEQKLSQQRAVLYELLAYTERFARGTASPSTAATIVAAALDVVAECRYEDDTSDSSDTLSAAEPMSEAQASALLVDATATLRAPTTHALDGRPS